MPGCCLAAAWNTDKIIDLRFVATGQHEKQRAFVKTKDSREMEKSVQTYFCKQRVILQSRVLPRMEYCVFVVDSTRQQGSEHVTRKGYVPVHALHRDDTDAHLG